MFGQIWAEFSSWDVISQVLVSFALIMGVLSALTAIPLSHARKMVDEMQGLVKTAKRQKRNAVAEVHTAYIEAMTATPAPPVEDWCPKCDKVHVRKLMKWNDEGQWVCIYCASPAIKTPPPELGPLAPDAGLEPGRGAALRHVRRRRLPGLRRMTALEGCRCLCGGCSTYSCEDCVNRSHAALVKAWMRNGDGDLMPGPTPRMA